MNYTLKMFIADIDDDIKNPSAKQVEHAIDLLVNNGGESDFYFIILEAEKPINNIEFIQCAPADDNCYLIEARVKHVQHQAFSYQKIVNEEELKEIFTNYLVGSTIDIGEWECPYEFYNEKELIGILAQHKLIGLKCVNIPQKNQIQLDNVNIYEFLQFAIENKINSIFYVYYGLDESEYSLENTISDNSILSKIAMEDIEKYKKLISSVDFSKKVNLVVFCLLHNSVIFRHFKTMESEIETSHHFFTRIRDKYDSELQDEKEKRKNEKDIILEQLRIKLLSDSEFLYCTNQTLRREYINKFLAKKENKEFADIFRGISGSLNTYEIHNWIDYVYQMVKRTKGKSSI